MKLFTKYSRINVLATISIFLIASFAFYFTLNLVLRNQIDEDLTIEKGEITTYVKKYNRLPENISVGGQIITYSPVIGETKTHYTQNHITQPGDKHKEEFRQLIFGIKAGQWYKVTVSKSLKDTDDLIHSVVIITLTTILIILLVSFLINRVVLKKLWKPFYQSLSTVQEFKLSRSGPLKFGVSRIEEFDLMNATLERLTSQAQAEYIALKTFSENASHEIQTPIAIIRSKLDLLIQDEQLTEHQSVTLQSAFNALQKLTRLNHLLLLLAKIENNQYEEVEKIQLGNLLEEKLKEFQELWLAQKIKVHSLIGNTVVRMNRELADVLLNNLLSNATKHNYTDGHISIELNESRLIIANSSPLDELEKQALFQRFYKHSQVKAYNGLGLSIIKQIGDASGFVIAYHYSRKFHVFTVEFGVV